MDGPLKAWPLQCFEAILIHDIDNMHERKVPSVPGFRFTRILSKCIRQPESRSVYIRMGGKNTAKKVQPVMPI